MASSNGCPYVWYFTRISFALLKKLWKWYPVGDAPSAIRNIFFSSWFRKSFVDIEGMNCWTRYLHVRSCTSNNPHLHHNPQVDCHVSLWFLPGWCNVASPICSKHSPKIASSAILRSGRQWCNHRTRRTNSRRKESSWVISKGFSDFHLHSN